MPAGGSGRAGHSAAQSIFGRRQIAPRPYAGKDDSSRVDAKLAGVGAHPLGGSGHIFYGSGEGVGGGEAVVDGKYGKPGGAQASGQVQHQRRTVAAGGEIAVMDQNDNGLRGVRGGLVVVQDKRLAAAVRVGELFLRKQGKGQDE